MKVQSIRPDTGRLRVQTVNDEESQTVQSDRHRAEMKEILRKYEAVGIIDHLRDVDLEFRDVSEFTDYRDMALQLKDAEARFMSLPSKVRELFNHSVEEYLDAAHDPEWVSRNSEALQRLGFEEVRPVAPEPPEQPPAAPGPAE